MMHPLKQMANDQRNGLRVIQKDVPCECVAAWVDTYDCICGEPEGVPMPLDVKKLKEAQGLVGELEALKRNLDIVLGLTDRLPARFTLVDEGVHIRHDGPRTTGFAIKSISRPDGTLIHQSSDEIPVRTLDMPIPFEMVASLLRTKIAETVARLQETGIVSAQQSPIRQVMK